MKPVPEIIKEFVLETKGRMPETDEEIDQYLDLLNHGEEYARALIIQSCIGKALMKRLGFKTPSEIKKQGIG